MNSLPRLSRRNFLRLSAFIGGLFLPYRQLSVLLASPKYKDYPFNLGVASGEPNHDSVVIWTKLASQSLPENIASSDIPVQWTVAKDEKMRNLVAKGTALATSELGHSIHVVVEGLQPAQWYWYQFQTGTQMSPIGRTRTAPMGSTEQLSFAFVSCQNYEHGYFNAYRHLAQEEIDFVIHLGDYIYEAAAQENPDFPRSHASPEPIDLDSYRQRYALYRSDLDLQEAHRLFPFICTWDDHEVENDYANLVSENFEEIKAFKARRAAAYQAYYEFLPLRPSARPQQEKMQLYRRLDWGNLATIHILDGRQYRDDQPCATEGKGGGQIIADCPQRTEEMRSLLGQEQEEWLYAGLSQFNSQWNIIAQPYLVSQLKRKQETQSAFWSDAWDGYPANRQRLLECLAEQRPSNPVFIGGDIHSFWVSELHTDFEDLNSPIVACEFVGTSISSNGISYEQVAAVLPDNPHLKFFESRLRGYVKCKVTNDVWQSDFQAVDTVKQNKSQLKTLASFQVKNGSSQIQQIL